MSVFLADEHFRIHVASFDDIIKRFADDLTSFSESDALKESHWDVGEDARLREDLRFRPTPWGRWMLSDRTLANDAIYRKFQDGACFEKKLEEAVQEIATSVGSSCIWCSADSRFVIENGILRLAAKELSKQPLIVEPIDLEKYTTHLPISTLEAVAASMPSGEWGPDAQELPVEPLGWLRVSIPGRRLNNKMFVAKIKGDSMNDGRSGLKDGVYAVFELWPVGTRQNLVVLVRGSFKDPATGSYAVKKYVADQRDEEGLHHRITLVSLNPDKDKYPDIELEPQNDDDVTVLARFIAALSPEDFARKPKPTRRPGRRDLTSEEALDRISARLARQSERFFEGISDADLDADNTVPSQWHSQLVCDDDVSGSLCLEIGPLQGLWSFVKRLCIECRDWNTRLLASNVRYRPYRVPVPVTVDFVRVIADGFEDDPDVDLSALDQSGLFGDRANAFRVDAAGIGRSIQSDVLSPGQQYRFLIPPVVCVSAGEEIETKSVGDGWGYWEVDMPTVPDAKLSAVIQKLGFQLGKPQPRLEWVLVPVSEWRTSPKGEPYACFHSATAPVVAVHGLSLKLEKQACLFIQGPTGTTSYSLPTDAELLLQLSALLPGRYVIALLHRHTKIQPARLAFEVVSEAPAPPDAVLQLTLGDEILAPQPGIISSVGPMDLADLDSGKDKAPFMLQLPPGWPMRVLWREVGDDFLGYFHAGLNGEADMEGVLAVSRERRKRRAIGELSMDFGELGCLVVKHERDPDPETIHRTLAHLVEHRGQTVGSLSGAYSELQKIWFEPVCRALGYDVEVFPVGSMPAPPEHVTAFRLLHTERVNDKIQRQAVRLLVGVEDLTEEVSKEMTDWIDTVCIAEGVLDALLTDGLHWAARRRGSRLALEVLNIASIVTDKDRFIGFLRTAAEGV